MAKLSPNYHREPTCNVKMLDSEQIAIRFEQIGSKERFRRLLQRFRDDFLLANCQEREGQPWWIVSAAQHGELIEFCKRNGLCLKEE